MTHDERIKCIMAAVDHCTVTEDACWKTAFLFLMEDFISKVEALTDRTPDFRTKGDPDHDRS